MPDVSNRQVMLLKLLSYVGEELQKARETDDHVIRMRHLERADVFLREASRVAGPDQ